MKLLCDIFRQIIKSTYSYQSFNIFLLFFQECLNKWDQIPDDTDILISHTPPVGYGDLCCTGVRAGCVELLNTVRLRVRPKVPIHKLRKQKLGILFFLVFLVVLHFPKTPLKQNRILNFQEIQLKQPVFVTRGINFTTMFRIKILFKQIKLFPSFWQ